MGGSFSRRSNSRRHSLDSHGHSCRYSASFRSTNSAHLGAYTTDHMRLSRRFLSPDQVRDALVEAGLESSNIILGVDFTKSNEWTGKLSFGRRCLHDLDASPNPYEQAISVIGRTLSAFDEDNLIPCFGFGDMSTHDQSVFSFTSDGKPCRGFAGVLQRYREVASTVQLAGPTSFAPIIEAAMAVVDDSGGQYHILLVIADGQVTQSINSEYGHLSVQEKATKDAISRASGYPLSIVILGVGDGPWDTMRDLNNCSPAPKFDNIQFVNFSEIMSRNLPESRKEREFMLAALKKVPSQYQAVVDLKLLGCRRANSTKKTLPPLIWHGNPENLQMKDRAIVENSYQRSTEESKVNGEGCPICLCKVKDLAFGCGHQTCYECGKVLQLCPICRRPTTIKIRLY